MNNELPSREFGPPEPFNMQVMFLLRPWQKGPHTLRSIYLSSKGACVKTQLQAHKEPNVHSQPDHLYKELFDLFIVQANSNI